MMKLENLKFRIINSNYSDDLNYLNLRTTFQDPSKIDCLPKFDLSNQSKKHMVVLDYRINTKKLPRDAVDSHRISALYNSEEQFQEAEKLGIDFALEYRDNKEFLKLIELIKDRGLIELIQIQHSA